MAEAVAGSTWQREFPLNSQASSHAFQSPPTIAVGDFKRSIVTAGGTVGSLTNLDNLPTIDPAGSVQVKIILSASETTSAGAGGHINIIGVDASGAEWDSIFISVDVEASTTNARASDIQSRIPTALVSGRIDSSVGAMASGVLTATAIAADAITDAKVASDVTIASVTGAVGSVTGNVGGSVASVTAGVSLADGAITAAKIAADAITAAKLASDVTTEIQSGLLTSTAFDAKIGTPAGASLAADVAAVKSDTAATLTDTAEIGTAGTGLTALASATNLATLAGYVDTEVAAIKAKTDNLPSDPADESSIQAAIAAVASDVSLILADTGTDGVVVATGSKTGYTLANDQSSVTVGTVNDLGTTARSRVNAEVLDVLNVDTFGESSGVPAATSTLIDKIKWLFTLSRNKLTQNSTTQTLRNDADSASIATSTVSDDGTTMTRGEWS